MTIGHHHAKMDTAEIYYCMSGSGALLMERIDEESELHTMGPGDTVYVPGFFGHRAINTGSEPFVFLFALRADAGADFSVVKERGFSRLLVDRKGTPTLVENERYHRKSERL